MKHLVVKQGENESYQEQLCSANLMKQIKHNEHTVGGGLTYRT